MGENTTISWCDHTFNPWIGCTRVSPACDHCYAATENQRRKWVPSWGEPGQPSTPRRRTKTWGEPLKWQRHHLQFYSIHRRPQRVFCASLADVFDNEALGEWRCDLFNLIRKTPDLQWILLTKRIGNARKMLPGNFGPDLYPNVGLMATIANQEEWDRDFPKLAWFKGLAAWIGVSAEPLLSSINIGDARPDWIITGGESGPQARPTHPDNFRSLRDQCAANGVAFHFKQWGEWADTEDWPSEMQEHLELIGKADGNNVRVGKKRAGALLDGVEHKAFPPALMRSAA